MSINSHTDNKQATAQRVLARLLEHTEVSPNYWRMKMRQYFVAQNAKPGQFAHLLPRRETLNAPLLRRAFSILNAQDDWFEILYRVNGAGTQNMTLFRPGDDIDVVAPLGNGFEYSTKHALLVGGGVGVPPMAMLAKFRDASAQSDNSTKVLIGARNVRDVICLDDFAKLGFEIGLDLKVATDDGSMGEQGLVTTLLERELQTQQSETVVYACGPWPMLRAVAEVCRQYEVPCQVSMEESMPCGVGVCNGCVVEMKNAPDEYSKYRRICVEGPVLWAHEVKWDVGN